MTSSKDDTSPVQVVSPQISILDFFFPGLTSISTIVEQLLTGKLNNYAKVFCSVGLVVFLCKYAYSYLADLVETHLCQSYSPKALACPNSQQPQQCMWRTQTKHSICSSTGFRPNHLPIRLAHHSSASALGDVRHLCLPIPMGRKRAFPTLPGTEASSSGIRTIHFFSAAHRRRPVLYGRTDVYILSQPIPRHPKGAP